MADTISRPSNVITLDCRQVKVSLVNHGSCIIRRAAAT